MHLPDGFLDGPTALATSGLALAGVSACVFRAERSWNERAAPLTGMIAAGVFAGQMLNFPISGAASGHLCGGLLAAVVLGPAAGSVALVTVVLAQCLLFADGGLTTLGANILNLGLIAPWAGFLVFWLLRRFPFMGPVAAAAVASFVSVLAAAFACCVELAAAGTAAFRPLVVTMLSLHAVIGIGEALLTALAVQMLAKARPSLFIDRPAAPFSVPSASGWSSRHLGAAGLSLALLLAGLLAPWASSLPDGLERAGEQLGFNHRAVEGGRSALFADYQIAGVAVGWGTAAAGILGTVLVFVIGSSWSRAMDRRPLTLSSLAGPLSPVERVDDGPPA